MSGNVSTSEFLVNRAARGADSPFLLLIDNDTEIQPGALARLVDAVESDPHVAGSGPMPARAAGAKALKARMLLPAPSQR